jgi:TELO2-interacting protein 1
VVKKCTLVISKSVEISGGDFFVRRFHTDGPTIWKLLTLSPFHRKPSSSNADKSLILLPYRAHPTSEEPMAEISSQKIQVAILDMIADLSSNKRSAVALGSVLKRVAGLVVGIACSTMTGLRKSALKALIGLSNIDSELIWLLVADVYYSLYRKNMPLQPDPALYGISELLPPPATSREFLYVQYGGESVGFDLDSQAVELVFKALEDTTDEVHCT